MDINVFPKFVLDTSNNIGHKGYTQKHRQDNNIILISSKKVDIIIPFLIISENKVESQGGGGYEGRGGN